MVKVKQSKKGCKVNIPWKYYTSQQTLYVVPEHTDLHLSACPS